MNPNDLTEQQAEDINRGRLRKSVEEEAYYDNKTFSEYCISALLSSVANKDDQRLKDTIKAIKGQEGSYGDPSKMFTLATSAMDSLNLLGGQDNLVQSVFRKNAQIYLDKLIAKDNIKDHELVTAGPQGVGTVTQTADSVKPSTVDKQQPADLRTDAEICKDINIIMKQLFPGYNGDFNEYSDKKYFINLVKKNPGMSLSQLSNQLQNNGDVKNFADHSGWNPDPASSSPQLGSGQMGGAPEPGTGGEDTTVPQNTPTQASAPVDNRTTDQKMSDFYVKLADAQADARAGNPQKLRDFDAFFNISRPEAEYTQAFYQTSSARLNEVNSLNVSQDIKNQIILEIQSGNQDSVQNLVNWFGAGKPASAVAVNLGTTQDGRIGLANALNVSQKVKDQIILEIQAGNPDSVQNLANWFNAGKPHSDAVMAIINAPAPVVATTPAVVGAVQPTAVTQPTAVQPTAVTQPTATVYPYYPSQSQGTNTNTGLASTGLDPSSDEYQYLSRKKGIDTAERMSAGAYKSTVAENEAGLTKAWADFKAVNDELKANGYSYLEAKDGMYGKAVSERGSYYDYLKKVEGPKGNINSVYGATAAGVIVNPIGNPTSPQFDKSLRDLANRAGAGGPHTLSGASSSLAQAKSFQEIQDRLIAKGVDLVKLEQDNPYSAGFGNNQQAMFGAVPATGQLNVSHPAGVLAGSNKTIDIFKEVEAATIQPANQTAQQPIISSNFDPGFNGPTAKPATGINAKPGYDSSQASTSGTASGSHTPNVVAQRGGEMSADDAFTAAPVTANGGTHVRNTKDSGFAYPWSAAKATGSSDVMGTIGKAVNFMNKHEGKNYKYDKAKGTIQAEDGSFISKEDVQSLNNIITKYHKTDFESPKASGSAPAQTSTFSAINEPTQDSLFANNSSNAAKIDGATNKDLFELPGATGVDVRTHPIEGGFNLP